VTQAPTVRPHAGRPSNPGSQVDEVALAVPEERRSGPLGDDRVMITVDACPATLLPPQTTPAPAASCSSAAGPGTPT
jgi:hypothetical protein